ncbi:hypothetical protein G7068_11945 [Leucobacter viscericola]|uniref:Uncharacterized protein n=1 Tax=Leucobacter viscericola TaxID=2714935 RepID=A0A6G7XHI0_9MICO|nr:hypothetical protein [Leucobacter viscericola]QIK63821.1 hypothetical protein G7068_11945 [Leucobacter viscericola]
MATYVRIQDRKHGIEDLLREGRASLPMRNEETDTRYGVSVCTNLEALMDYYVQCPIEIGDDPVIITLEGDIADDQPLDAEYGEILINATRVVSIESAEDAGFFDGINARLDS